MLFKKYDVSGDGLINITEFNDLIKKVDDKLTEMEVKYLFDLFDVDKNG
jgi:troponin C